MDDPDSDADREAIRNELATKATAIEEELAGLTTPMTDAGSIQFGKRAGDATNVAAEQLARVATVEQLDVVLGEIRRAEAKLAAGTYGFCDECGSPIGAGRLDALSWAVKCVTCASGRARRGRR